MCGLARHSLPFNVSRRHYFGSELFETSNLMARGAESLVFLAAYILNIYIYMSGSWQPLRLASLYYFVCFCMHWDPNLVRKGMPHANVCPTSEFHTCCEVGNITTYVYITL